MPKLSNVLTRGANNSVAFNCNPKHIVIIYITICINDNITVVDRKVNEGQHVFFINCGKSSSMILLVLLYIYVLFLYVNGFNVEAIIGNVLSTLLLLLVVDSI
jgi:hypothetical protein